MLGAQFKTEVPVQLYHLGNPQVKCHLLEPADELKFGIYYYWHIEIANRSVELDVIPDNAIDLVMSPDLADFSAMYLPVAEKFVIPIEGPVRFVGVCFAVDQVTRFFNVSVAQMRSLSDGATTTAALGIKSLLSRLQGDIQLHVLKSHFDAEFSERLVNSTAIELQPTQLHAARLIEAMQQTLGDSGVSELAARFELSDRQFRRILTGMFGFGPKKIQRIVRLQQALKELVRAEDAGTLDGYYDDAHRIRELKTLTGMTPGDIRRMAEIYNNLD